MIVAVVVVVMEMGWCRGRCAEGVVHDLPSRESRSKRTNVNVLDYSAVVDGYAVVTGWLPHDKWLGVQKVRLTFLQEMK